jgi:hypothetical protein
MRGRLKNISAKVTQVLEMWAEAVKLNGQAGFNAGNKKSQLRLE